jgi:thioredoxin 1
MGENRPVDDELQRIREQRMRELQEGTWRKKGSVLDITDDTFSAAIRTQAYLVVDFWAEWCGPCQMVAPAIEELARDFAGKVTFGKCNVDLNPGIAGSFTISAIPTLLFFADGMLVDRVIGAQPKEAIRSRILRAFGAG